MAHGGRWAGPGGIALDQPCDGSSAEAGDIVRDQRLSRAGLLDEDRAGGSAAQRLEPQRTGSREEVEDACAVDRVAEAAMGEGVEQAFAHAIAGGPERMGRIALAEPCKRPPAPAPANDPHEASSVFRSVHGSAIAIGSGLLPPSIRRLPTM